MITGWDVKNHKASQTVFNVGPLWGQVNANKMVFRWLAEVVY